MIKVKDGYAKLIGTTYKGSPDWVLLSNGGHKPISDFATASGVVTALGTNGNYVTWTKNGTVNNLTVPYATNADKIDGKHESDLFVSQRGLVNVNYIDLTSSTSGNENYKLYDSGIYTVPRSGYSDAYIVFKSTGSTSAVELMTNYQDTARLKLRKTVDNNRVSGPWRELAFTSDVPTKVSQLTNDSGYLTSTNLTNYVTLNGNLTISGVKTFSTQLKFTVADGTAPFTVTSKTKVDNLNADMVGGYISSVLFTCESGYGVDVNAPHRNKESGPLLYRISDNCANIPPGCVHGVLVHFNSQGTDTAFQLASNYSNTGLYYRSGNFNESGSSYLYNRAWKQLAFIDTSSLTPSGGTLTINGNLTVDSLIASIQSTNIVNGTGSLAGDIDPTSLPLIGALSVNKFFGTPAEKVLIEYSNDSGDTWSDYSLSASQKFNLFGESISGLALYLGGNEANGSTDNQLRITITAHGYYALNKIFAWFSTQGNACYCDCERYNYDGKWHSVWSGRVINGWKGPNVFNFNSFNMNEDTTHSSYNSKLRLTFYQTGMGNRAKNALLLNIRGFGNSTWIARNNITKFGRLYDIDREFNALFQNGVYPNSNGIGSLGSSISKWNSAYINNVYSDNLHVNGDTTINGKLTATSLAVNSTTMVTNLNADRLDGLHKDEFQQAVYTYFPTTYSIANTTTLANIISPNLTSDSDSFKFYDTKFYGTASSTSNRTQIAYGYAYDNIHFRRYYNGAWTAWKEVAFTDSNVASATKLKTSRTIWGLSFDGTKNVQGALSGATTITTSGNITTGNSTTTSNLAHTVENNNGKIGIYASTRRGLYDYTIDNWLIGTDGTNTRLMIGNIGIGTDSPTQKLDVNGNVRIYSTNLNEFIIHRHSTTSGAYVTYKNDNGTLGILGLSNDTKEIYLYKGDDESTPYIIYHTGNLDKSTLGLGNVQNTAFYKRVATVNGTGWDMAGTINSTAFTIYAPTTAGTSGQVLISSGGTPGWTNLGNITAGVANKLKNLGKHSEVVSSTTVPSALFEGAYYNSGMFMTSNMNDSATPCSFGNIINVLGNGGGLLLLGWEGSYKTGNIYYRSHRDMVDSGGWTPWRLLAFIDSLVDSAKKANTASKLTTARTINVTVGGTSGTAQSFDGSSNITIPVSGMGEAYLTWGGKNISGDISPIDAAASLLHSANKFELANPDGIIIEYSTDSGATWLEYSTNDETKVNLVSAKGALRYYGGSSTVSLSGRLRVTLIASSMNVYTALKKLLINCSTNGSKGCTVTVETSKNGSETTFSTIGTYNIFGWSGWNSIPCGFSFGGLPKLTDNTARIRLTFSHTSLDSSLKTNPTILNINAIGTTNWGSPSTIARTGHLYSYDYLGNASFPAKITATKFIGNLNHTLTFSAGKFAANTYNNSSAVTVNIPTHTSHLTNDSGFITINHTHSYASVGYVAFTPASGELSTSDVLSKTGSWSLKKGTWNYAGNGYIKADDFGNIDLAGTSILTFGNTDSYTQLYITAPAQSGHSGKTNEIFFYNNHGADYSPGWTRVITNRNYTDYVNTTNFPGLNKTGTVTSIKVGSTSYSPTSGVVSLPAYPTSLKSPNAIKFKNTAGTKVSYDGSAAVDLTGGIYSAKQLTQVLFTSGLDLNTIKTEQVYVNTLTSVCSSLLNGPSGRSNGEIRLESVNCGSDTYGFLTLYARSSNTYEIWYRTWANSDFTSWVKNIHSGNYTDYTVKKDGTGASGTWGINITGNAGSVKGSYTSNGGQQNPNYFGKNKVGFLMMNTTVNNNANYKDWMIMDCYAESDVGGAVAFGVNRQSLGAYIMRSASERTSWTESAELLGTHNYNNYALSLSGGTLSGDLTLLNLYVNYMITSSKPSGALHNPWSIHMDNYLWIQSATADGTNAKGKIALSGKGAESLTELFLKADLTKIHNTILFNKLSAPTTSGGSTYGPGANGQVLKSNGSTVYWANDNNSYGYIGTTAVQSSSKAQSLTGIINITASGNIIASGEITAYSDRRLKSNIKPLENRGYIQPMTYIKDNKECIGFIAQDVLEKYPELVNDNSEYLSLNYLQYVAVLQALIIELEKRIKELENGTRKL